MYWESIPDQSAKVVRYKSAKTKKTIVVQKIEIIEVSITIFLLSSLL